MPSVRDFCEQHNILWFPIVLEIKQNKEDPNKKEKVLKPIKNSCYAHDKKNKQGEPFISYKPEPTDFSNLSIEAIKKRQEFITMSDWIAIDTRYVHQIDIDHDEIDDGYDKLMEQTPYFKSATKGFPHMFIKQEGFTPQSVRIQLKNGGIKPFYPKNNDEGVELLCGQWSYARWNDEMVNGDKPPFQITHIEMMFLSETDKKLKKVKKMLPPENVMDNISVVSELTDVIEPTEEKNDDYNIIINFIEKGLLKCDTHQDWINVGTHLKILFDDNDASFLWGKFTTLYGSTNKKNEYKEKFDKIKPKTDDKQFAFNVLKKYARENDLDKYNQIMNKFTNYFISLENLRDTFKLAEIITPRLRHTLILCKEQWYMLNSDNLWIQQKEPAFYIVNEIRKYIDYSNLQIVIQIEKTKEEKKRSELIRHSKEYIEMYACTAQGSFISVMKQFLKTSLLDNTFGDKLDSKTDTLAFKNGIMCLKTKTFREGILSSDFLTSTIPTNYTPCDLSKIEFVKNHFKKILNNNDEHLHYFLCCIGACLIGKPELIKSIFFFVDKTDCGRGDNGKSFILKILSHLMPNYVYKTKANLIDVKNAKIHKQLVKTKGKKIVYMEELPLEKETNASLLKDIGDGDKIENEILFGTSEDIILTWILFALTNHIPNIDPKENAVYNRYRQISFNSHFDRTGQRLIEDPTKLLFIADPKLPETMITQYSHEIFHILIDYANKFYTNGDKLPEIPAQFVKDTEDTKLNNDKFASWFNDNCMVNDSGKVALKELSSLSGMSADKVKEGMKRKGYKYNRDLSGIGKDAYNKHYKGGYEGCCLKPDDAVDEEVNK